MEKLPEVIELDIEVVRSTDETRYRLEMPFTGEILGFYPGTAILCVRLREDWAPFEKGDTVGIDLDSAFAGEEV